MLTERMEIGAIHFALEELQAWAGRGIDITQLLAKCGAEEYRVAILERMLAEGLVTKVAPEYSFFAVTPTPQGLRIARHVGGYQGYLDGLKEAALHKENLERATAQATIDGVRANW